MEGEEGEGMGMGRRKGGDGKEEEGRNGRGGDGGEGGGGDGEEERGDGDGGRRGGDELPFCSLLPIERENAAENLASAEHASPQFTFAYSYTYRCIM